MLGALMPQLGIPFKSRLLDQPTPRRLNTCSIATGRSRYGAIIWNAPGAGLDGGCGKEPSRTLVTQQAFGLLAIKPHARRQRVAPCSLEANGAYEPGLDALSATRFIHRTWRHINDAPDHRR